MKTFYVLICTLLFLICISCRQKRAGLPHVLVYTQHISSPDEVAALGAIRHLGDINGFEINATDTSNMFSDDSLQAYAAVVCLNRCGTELGSRERIALERFMEAGGGFAGIHPMMKTGNWKWYGDMIGSNGDSGVSFIHQKYENGRATYECDSLNSHNANDEAKLKDILNAIEYAIGHYEPLDYAKAKTKM
jgi:type 1 glutamine amidotransferase